MRHSLHPRIDPRRHGDLPWTPIRQVGGYRELAPPPELAHVVDAMWVFAVPSADGQRIASARHRVLPELGISLTFECWRDAAGRADGATLSVQGPIRCAHSFAPSGTLHLESVRVNPEWARDLFGTDPTAHADGYAAYRDVHRARAEQLYERLIRTTSSAQALQLLLHEVAARLHAAPVTRALSLAHGAAELLRSASPALQLGDIARRTRITERHLRRVIRDGAGIGAKQFQRVHRLNRAVALADGSARPAWASIAIEAGYYDQSHMIQDFRSLTGCAPRELHAERQAERLPLPA